LYQACTGLKGSPLLLLLLVLPKRLPLLLLLLCPKEVLLEAGMPRGTPMLAKTSALLLLPGLLPPALLPLLLKPKPALRSL
jgi:hypothetical protein